MTESSPSKYMKSALALSRIIGSELVTQSDYCKIIGLMIFPENPPKTVSFFTIHSNGTYSLTHSFGFPENLEELSNPVTLEISSPIVDSIRNSRVVWVENLEVLNLEYPNWAKDSPIKFCAPIIAIPLLNRGVAVGALCVTGTREELSADSITYLELIANLLSVNLRREILLALEIAGPIKGFLLGLPLTPREKDIQAMMGGGSTNREISVELGFSESTVRKDSVSLFAKLGVNNRKDAGDLL